MKRWRRLSLLAALAALPRRPHDKSPLPQILQRVLEGSVVLGREEVDWPAVAAGGADPAAEDAIARTLRGLLGEGEEDRELGLVIEVAADDLQRVRVQDGQELVVGEPEAVLQQRGGGGGQRLRTAGSLRRRPR
jgi:hypothetical protein